MSCGPSSEPGDAVLLFMDRAATHTPRCVPSTRELPTVAALCVRLDGIPLAIELAAAQLRLLSVEQNYDMLQDRFRLLTNHHCGTPSRHHILLTAIGWSHELCTPAERLLWARLSVFPASFDLEAVEEICSDPNLPRTDIDRVLHELAAKSIVISNGGPEQPRFTLLDTVRAYGRTWLKAIHEQEQLEGRHAAFYLRLARQAEASWSGPTQLGWYHRMTTEHPHTRAALEHFLTNPSHTRQALELASRMWFLWVGCGRLREGRHYLDRALHPDIAPCPERTRALWTCGWIASVQIDAAGATPCLDEAARACDALGDPRNAAFTLQRQGQVAFLGGDWDRAIGLLTRAVAQHDPHSALNPGPIPARTALAAAWLARARTEEAVAVLTEARTMCTAAGEIWMCAHLDWLLAQADRARGRFSAAVARCRDALRVQHAFHDVIGMAVTLEVLAGLRASLLDASRTARLLGAARTLRRTYAVSITGAPFLAAIRTQATHTALEQLGPDAFESAFADGACLDLAHIVAYALNIPLVPTPAIPTAHRRPLSATETTVAQLVAQGLRDPPIADRLQLTPHTVTEHIHALLTSLGLISRDELATWATWHRPTPNGNHHTGALHPG